MNTSLRCGGLARLSCFLLLLNLLTTLAISQEITFSSDVNAALQRLGINPSDTLQVLDSLFSSNSEIQFWTVRYCGENRLRMAIPSLRQLFVQYPASDQKRSRSSALRVTVLESVIEIGDSSFRNELRIEIDSLRSYDNNSYELILFSSYLMRQHSDDYGYTAIHPFYADDEKRAYAKPRVYALRPFLIGSHREDVLQLLRENVRLHPVKWERAKSLELLDQAHDANVDSLELSVSQFDTSYEVRTYSRYLLKQRSTATYLFSLMTAAAGEADASHRLIVYSNLIATRLPSAYKFVSDILLGNQDEQNNGN
ncbi:MAG: hypothetical protein HW407_785, partial [Bacteroidetes bacterium]|nr:hypothetical protein [Bacteroidota bacterium]